MDWLILSVLRIIGENIFKYRSYVISKIEK